MKAEHQEIVDKLDKMEQSIEVTIAKNDALLSQLEISKLFPELTEALVFAQKTYRNELQQLRESRDMYKKTVESIEQLEAELNVS